jgi:proton-dependent oligopeptide transporter, POT family
MAKTKSEKFPPQIKYIVGNEGCERYSYYGMRSILVPFMIAATVTSVVASTDSMAKSYSGLGFTKEHATEVMHLFMAVCYLLPLLGAYIADRFWGRYKTILYLSLFYCVGHATLAVFEKYEWGLYAGLGLIALGSGGIKPCISAFVGDQFASDQKDLLSKVYGLFYWMINFGSFFSTILTPLTLELYGPTVAFGIPGVLMFIATLIFWLGRKHYKRVEPSGPDPDSFWSILAKGIFHNMKFGGSSQALGYVVLALYIALSIYGLVSYGLTGWFVALLVAGLVVILAGLNSFWTYVQKNHPAKRVEEFKISLGIAKVFASVTVFWALFDQHASTWVIQAENMDRMVNVNLFGWQIFQGEILAAQVSAINPILVLMLIPLFTFFIYPAIHKVVPLTPLRKMGMGFMIAAVGFASAALIEYSLEQGDKVHIYWQFFPYLFMTMAEVMISITGLEFAYTQAPKKMKSTIMSFWLLTVFIGNLLTAVIVKVEIFPVGSGHFYMLFAGLIFASGLMFAFLVRNHQTRDITID